jgi:hypothetical protein
VAVEGPPASSTSAVIRELSPGGESPPRLAPPLGLGLVPLPPPPVGRGRGPSPLLLPLSTPRKRSGWPLSVGLRRAARSSSSPQLLPGPPPPRARGPVPLAGPVLVGGAPTSSAPAQGLLRGPPLGVLLVVSFLPRRWSRPSWVGVGAQEGLPRRGLQAPVGRCALPGKRNGLGRPRRSPSPGSSPAHFLPPPFG